MRQARGRLAVALAASLGLHALALAAAWLGRPAPRAGPSVQVSAPVRVRLLDAALGGMPAAGRARESPPGEDGTSGRAAVTGKPEPAPEGPAHPRAASGWSEPRQARPAESDRPSTPLGASGILLGPSPSAALPDEGALAGGAPSSGGSPPGAVGASGSWGSTEADLGALDALHKRLVQAAESCYPPAGRRLRLRGQAKLAFCAGSGGVASSIQLLGSTGSALLDDAARTCVVARAEPLPATSGCYTVELKFGADGR